MSGLAFPANAATAAPSTWTVPSDVLDAKVTAAAAARGLNGFRVEPDIAHRAAVKAAAPKQGLPYLRRLDAGRPSVREAEVVQAVLNLTRCANSNLLLRLSFA
jgi:hypothetical protein